MKHTAENVLAFPGRIIAVGQHGYESLGESGQVMAKSALSTTLSTCLWPMVYATVDILGENFGIPSEARLLVSWLVWGQLSYDISCIINRFLSSSTALASPDEEMQEALTEALEPEHWYSAISNAVAPYAQAAGEYYERIPAPMRFAAGATGGYAMRFMMQKAGIPQAAQTVFYSAVSALSMHKGDRATSTGVLLAPALETAVSMMSEMSDTQLRGLMEFCGLKGRATPGQLRESLQDSKTMDMALQSIGSAQTRRELAPRFTPVFSSNGTFYDACGGRTFCEQQGFTTPDGVGRNQYNLRLIDPSVNVDNKIGFAFTDAEKEAPKFITDVINAVTGAIHQVNGSAQGQLRCNDVNTLLEVASEQNFSFEFLEAFAGKNATEAFCSTISRGPGDSGDDDPLITALGAFFGSSAGLCCLAICCACVVCNTCLASRKVLRRPTPPRLGEKGPEPKKPGEITSTVRPPDQPMLRKLPPRPHLHHTEKPTFQRRTPHTMKGNAVSAVNRYLDGNASASSGFSRGGDARRIENLLQYEPHIDPDDPLDGNGDD